MRRSFRVCSRAWIRRCLIAGCGYTGLRLARRLQPAGGSMALARSADGRDALDRAGIAVAARRPRRAASPGRDWPRSRTAPRSPTWCRRPTAATAIRAWSASSGALGAARPSVLLYMSTTGVYGDTAGPAVTEAIPGRARATIARVAAWRRSGSPAAGARPAACAASCCACPASTARAACRSSACGAASRRCGPRTRARATASTSTIS